MAENGRFVGPRGPNYDPFFNFFLITSKYAKKHHIKKSDKSIHYIQYYLSPKDCRNGKKWCVFLALGGRILTLFSRYLVQIHHIKKSEKIIKNHSLEKIPSPKNCKNSQKVQFFLPYKAKM